MISKYYKKLVHIVEVKFTGNPVISFTNYRFSGMLNFGKKKWKKTQNQPIGWTSYARK